jgi:hypothetical protein
MTMSLDRLIVEYLILVPIAFLLLVGVVIALRSGAGDPDSGQDRMRLFRNLTQMLLRIAAYVAILMTLQHLIGLRPSLGW